MPLSEQLVTALAARDPAQKARLTQQAVARWHRNGDHDFGDALPPDRPGRPTRPELRRPGDMPKRRAAGSLASRIALLHALAHIELNAIDLACDIIVRFGKTLPPAFTDDWLQVADEEAKHFRLLSDRLGDLGAAYGDLAAHDGLWQAAIETRHDLLARLAVVPLVLEARGLDVTPQMIGRLERAGDPESAAVLQVIYEDEIGHVAIGKRWFDRLCARQGQDPVVAWRTLVDRHFNGVLKPPFNHKARAAAGFPVGFIDESLTEKQPDRTA